MAHFFKKRLVPARTIVGNGDSFPDPCAIKGHPEFESCCWEIVLRHSLRFGQLDIFLLLLFTFNILLQKYAYKIEFKAVYTHVSNFCIKRYFHLEIILR